jgi:Zn finger protein HypA/HybF involved in hydrogenase expression
MTEERFRELEAWARGENLCAISRDETIFLVRERRRLLDAAPGSFRCPQCGGAMELPEIRTFTCPLCGRKVTVPLSQG